MSTRRIMVFVVDTTDASEALRTALHHAAPGHEPWLPTPAGENMKTYVQERWSREKTDAWIIEMLREHADAIHLSSTTILDDR